MFVGTEVFALISFCVYFIFAIIMVVLQAAISEHLGIRKYSYSTTVLPQQPVAFTECTAPVGRLFCREVLMRL